MKENKELPGYYAIFPASVRYDQRLSDFAKVLFCEITALSNKYGYCTATNSHIAELYGKNPTWVSEVISSLQAAGHIKIKVTKNFSRKIWPITQHLQKPKPPSGKTEGGVSGKAEDNNTSNNNTSNISATAKAVADLSPKKLEKKDPNEPLTLITFIESCRASKQRHINIIGEYADERKPAFVTRGQWEQFIRRNLRAARDLSAYTDPQIAKAMRKVKDASKEGGYLTKWSLETLIKFLD